MTTNPNRPLVAVSAALLGALGGCWIEPSTPELRYSLNPKALALNEDIQDDPTAQDQLRGALEMLFGTPSNPGYMLTGDWIEVGYDPNYSQYPEDDFGSGDLSESQLEDIHADNQRRFARDLEAIEEGRFGDVRLHREAIDLRASWSADLEEWEDLRDRVEAGEAEQAELDAFVTGIQEGTDDADGWPVILTNWYPSLRESAELYRQQCLHCHGVSGGGDGPTAPYLNPKPRDYRPGTFKFTALDGKQRPRREDLYRILTEGIYTTMMPSFRRFSDAQLHGLVDYVRLLAIRGEVEFWIAGSYELDEGGISWELVREAYEEVWKKWLKERDVIAYGYPIPPATPERIARGRELFLAGDKANCASCHGPDGRGGGPSAEERNPVTGEMEPVKDDWGNPIIIRDLTRGL
ncbi:MAG: c-type cytochrome, partial [Planctomycetota bacterium]|nr:c-type cytochrome [Planctomycetota bacterium]